MKTVGKTAGNIFFVFVALAIVTMLTLTAEDTSKTITAQQSVEYYAALAARHEAQLVFMQKQADLDKIVGALNIQCGTTAITDPTTKMVSCPAQEKAATQPIPPKEAKK